jgi:hypothetical protein
MAIFLYRKNGGQALAVSVDGAAFTGLDTTFFDTLTNPPVPDGVDLSVPKMWDGTSLRNATAPEQTAFVTAAATDLTLQQRAKAVAALQSDPNLRKILRAIVGLTVQQINTLRTQPTTVFSAITEAQAQTSIVAAINAGTYD